MKRLRKVILALAVVAATPAAAIAGPCTAGIDKLQVAFDHRLDTAAAAGPSGAETTDAKLHHQPTQQSVADAEEKLGDITPDMAQTFVQAMESARDADAAGNKAKCSAALHDARSALKL